MRYRGALKVERAKKYKLVGLKKLIPYLLKRKLSLFAILIISLLGAALSLTPILFIGGIVDVLSGKPSTLVNWFPFLSTGLTGYIIGFALVYYLQNIFSLFNGHLISVMVNKIVEEVRLDAFYWGLNNLKPHRETTKTSDVVSRITGDVEAIVRALAGPLNGLLPLILKLIGSVVILAYWSGALAIVAVILMLLIYLASLTVARRAKTIAKEQRGAQANLLGAATDALYNLPVIKVFRGEKYERELFRPFSNRILKLFLSLQWSFSIYWFIVYTLMATGYVVAVVITINNIKLGLLGPGSLPIAYSYITNILSPMVSVSRYQNDLYQADAAIQRVFQLGEGLAEDAPRGTPPSQIAEAVSVEFKDVSIECNERVGLEGLSFIVNKNGILALIGASGQGKSTVIQALLNNHQPGSGTILVDGVELAALKDSIYPCIGVSFQDPYLFERSIVENIIYGTDEYDEKRFTAVNKALGLDTLIQDRGKGYNVGLQGKNLSGGEKKRVSLARALNGDPKALYIFDEPTAELDEENRKLVIEVIKGLRRRATVIVTTHDEDMLAAADVIVDLNKHIKDKVNSE